MFDENEEGIRQGRARHRAAPKLLINVKFMKKIKISSKKIKIARKKIHADEERLKAECGLA